MACIRSAASKTVVKAQVNAGKVVLLPACLVTRRGRFTVVSRHPGTAYVADRYRQCIHAAVSHIVSTAPYLSSTIRPVSAPAD